MRWQEYKQIRREYFKTYIFGNKMKKCVACNGTGYYDHSFPNNPNPKCGSCKGVGKVRERAIKPFWLYHRRTQIEM